MLDKLKEEKIVSVIRADNIQDGMNLVDAIYAGGIKAIELTYSIPNVCDLIQQVINKYPDCLVGVGSVLNVKQAKEAIKAGATYVVSPGYVEAVQKYCDKVGLIYMPGAMTVTEIIKSMENGNEITKLFPGDVLGINFIKSVKAPIPNAQLMVTGGVNLENINEWFAAGVSMVGIGSNLTKLAKKGNYSDVTKMAKRYKEEIKK